MPKATHSSKITDSHSTATEATQAVIALAAKLEEVTKICLGPITPIGGGGKKRIKFLPIPAGIMAVVRGGGTVQDVFIYTNKPSFTKKSLEKIFD